MLMGTLMLNGCALSILIKPFCTFQDLARDSEKSEPLMDKMKGTASIHGSMISLTPSFQRIPSAKSLQSSKPFLEKLNQVFNLKMLQNVGVLFTFFECLLFFLAHPVVQIFLPNVTSFYGIDGGTSSMMLAALAISDFIARLGFGFIGSTQKVNKSNILIIIGTMSAISHIIMTWTKSSTFLFVLVSSLGICQGKRNTIF